MRHAFGGGAADFAYADADGVDGVDDLAQFNGGAVMTAWTAETGGSALTDLTSDRAGLSPITTLLSSNGGDGRSVGAVPPFYGPDTVTKMWLSADGGPRHICVTTDAADIVNNPGMIAQFYVAGTVNVGTGKGKYVNLTGTEYAIAAVRLELGTAPTGASFIVDVNRNGTTIYPVQAERPAIVAAATSSGNVVPTDVPLWSPGDSITVDVDQVGSGTHGADLTVMILLVPTLV
jgi:hypothetical protein